VSRARAGAVWCRQSTLGLCLKMRNLAADMRRFNQWYSTPEHPHIGQKEGERILQNAIIKITDK
jgi:hypothetical protein